MNDRTNLDKSGEVNRFCKCGCGLHLPLIGTVTGQLSGLEWSWLKGAITSFVVMSPSLKTCLNRHMLNISLEVPDLDQK